MRPFLMVRRKKVTYWTMKNGTKIRISDMEDSHLLNSIRMIERICQDAHSREIDACGSIVFQGEMACEAQDNFLAYSSWMDYVPDSYEYLVKEAVKRGILKEDGK